LFGVLDLHDLVDFTMCGDFIWRYVWLWRISGGYSQEMMWLTLRVV